MTKNRSTNFDILRSLAAFMVVCIHTTIYYWQDCIPGSLDFLVYTAFNCFGRSAVPIFFMISGAFMLQKETEIKYMLKKAGKLALVYLVWMAIYAVFELEGSILQFDFGDWINSWTAEKYHLWFMPIMFSIYLMMPVLQAVVRYKDGYYVRYLATLFFVATICKCTLIVVFPEADLLTHFMGKISVELCEYTGYYILGYYLLHLSKPKVTRRQAGVLYVGITLFAIMVTFVVSTVQGAITNIFASYFTIPVFFEGIFLFLYFRESKEQLDKHKLLSKIGKFVSATSLGVYLLHVFVIEHMDGWFGINTKIAPAIIAVPLVALLYFGITVVIVAIMKRIPVIRKMC